MGLKTFGLVLAAMGFLNFAAFFATSMGVGGSPDDALSGDGRWYVSDHGKATEVTERTFRLMRMHERSVWVTHPLAFFGFLIYGSSKGWKPRG